MFIGLMILMKGNVAQAEISCYVVRVRTWNEIGVCKARTRIIGAILWTCSEPGRLNTRLYQSFPTHCAC